MKTIEVPKRENVSANNQAIFDQLEKQVGFVPNLYATYAYSETALSDYLTLSNRKTSLSSKEKEVINLVVSQVNDCKYCLAAHTAIGKMNGFTEDQIVEIRSGEASFNQKLDALAKFVHSASIKRGKADENLIEELFEVGYNEANLVDIVMVIGDKTISNYLHSNTQIPVDFPAAVELEFAV